MIPCEQPHVDCDKPARLKITIFGASWFACLEHGKKFHDERADLDPLAKFITGRKPAWARWG